MDYELINILLLILIFVITIFIKKKVQEPFIMPLENVKHNEYDDYIKGEKVDTIFSKDFIEKIKDNDIIHLPHKLVLLHRLYKELLNIKNFDEKLFMKLIQPYKNSPVEKIGIFDKIDFDHSLYKIKNNQDILNDQQKKSFNEFYDKRIIKNEIDEIVDFRMNDFLRCENKIEKFIGINDFSFYKWKNDLINLENYKKEDLINLKKKLESLPEGFCEIIDFYIDAHNFRKNKIKELSNCKEELRLYIEDKYEMFEIKSNNEDILEDDLLKHKKYNIRFIHDLYKYIIDCNDLKEDYDKEYLENSEISYKQTTYLKKYKNQDYEFQFSEDMDELEEEDISNIYKNLYKKTIDNLGGYNIVKEEETKYKIEDKFETYNRFRINDFLRKKARYIYNLKKLIDIKKVENKDVFKNNLENAKEFIKTEYLKNGIPLFIDKYPLERLGKYDQYELEKINRIYDDFPKSNDIEKRIIINKIYEVYKNIIYLSNHTYGCLYSIIGYLTEHLKDDLDITYDEFKNIDFLKKKDTDFIKKLFSFIKNTPPCLDINYKGQRDFDVNNDQLISSYDYNFNQDHLFDPKTRSYSGMRNQLKLQKLKTSKEGIQNVKAYHPYLDDHRDADTNDTIKLYEITEDGRELDRFFKSDEFKSCTFNDDNDTQLKNSLHKYIDQHNLTKVGSVFAPTIEIDRDALDKVDLEALKKSMRIKS